MAQNTKDFNFQKMEQQRVYKDFLDNQVKYYFLLILLD